MSAPRLLLVDDDRLVLATLAHGLAALGYEVATADSGEAALAAAADGAFDLAIVDVRMPGLPGIELCHALAEGHRVPSLFLSAFGDREEVERAIGEGGLGYLVKPVDAPRLVPAIEAALARARDLRALFEAKAQLEQALAGGRYTSMAIGILMATRGFDERAAFEVLRGEARHGRRKLEDHCRELVRAFARDQAR